MVKERLNERRDKLRQVWETDCAPISELDITEVTWDQVCGFTNLVGEIKPMKHSPSTVFTSKFCHFLLPKVFPVVDNEGCGKQWSSYEQYFNKVKCLWESTSQDTRTALIAAMTEAVEDDKRPKLSPQYPIVNKIVELRLIGLHQKPEH